MLAGLQHLITHLKTTAASSAHLSSTFARAWSRGMLYMGDSESSLASAVAEHSESHALGLCSLSCPVKLDLCILQVCTAHLSLFTSSERGQHQHGGPPGAGADRDSGRWVLACRKQAALLSMWGAHVPSMISIVLTQSTAGQTPRNARCGYERWLLEAWQASSKVHAAAADVPYMHISQMANHACASRPYYWHSRVPRLFRALVVQSFGRLWH